MANRPHHLDLERDTLAPVVPATQIDVDVVPATQVDVDPDDLAGYRPSHRFLAWYQNRLGIDLRSDLLGDDQPDLWPASTRPKRTGSQKPQPVPG